MSFRCWGRRPSGPPAEPHGKERIALATWSSDTWIGTTCSSMAANGMTDSKSRESFTVRFGNAVLGRGESNCPFKISIFQLSRNSCCQCFQGITIRSAVSSFRYRLQLVGGWVRFHANKQINARCRASAMPPPRLALEDSAGRAEQMVQSSFGAA